VTRAYSRKDSNLKLYNAILQVRASKAKLQKPAQISSSTTLALPPPPIEPSHPLSWAIYLHAVLDDARFLCPNFLVLMLANRSKRYQAYGDSINRLFNIARIT
jgi:hypothetical protein